MAVISLSGLISSIKGSIGGTTFQRSAAGTIMRNKPKPVGKGTNSQAFTRQIQSIVNQQWKSLTDQQRTVWATFASFSNGANKTTRGNRSANTGKLQFLTINFWLQQYGKSILTLPTIGPTEPGFIPCPPDYTETSNLMDYEGSLQTASQILVTRVSLPQSNATNTANTGMRTLVYTQVNGDEQDWSEAYYQQYGIVLQYNYKYWIELRVVNYITGAISAAVRRLVSYVPPAGALHLVVDTTKAGSASDTFILPCGNVGTYNATIYWGDGSNSVITVYNDADLTHVYPVAGTYHIYITGALNKIEFNNGGDRLKLIDIAAWGDWHPLGMSNAFYGCSNLVGTWSDVLDLSGASSFTNSFRLCAALIGSFSGWNTSTITAMNNCFMGATSVNPDVSGWNVTNVTNVLGMFNGATSANCNVSAWNVINIAAANLFMNNTALSTVNLNAIYNAWSLLSVESAVTISFGSTKYTIATAGAARAVLTGAPNNWVITDGGGI